MNNKLELMWDQQEEFMRLLQRERNFPAFPVDLKSKQGQKLLKDISHHMMDELFEAGQLLKNAKSHRITEVPEVDRDHYIEELSDTAHLFFELLIASGVTLDEFFAAYMKKGDVNIARISEGY